MAVICDGLRPADQVALNLTFLPRKKGALLLGLDAFRDDRQRQRAPQPQDRVDDRGGLEAVADPGDEGPVDLILSNGKSCK